MKHTDHRASERLHVWQAAARFVHCVRSVSARRRAGEPLLEPLLDCVHLPPDDVELDPHRSLAARNRLIRANGNSTMNSITELVRSRQASIKCSQSAGSQTGKTPEHVHRSIFIWTYSLVLSIPGKSMKESMKLPSNARTAKEAHWSIWTAHTTKRESALCTRSANWCCGEALNQSVQLFRSVWPTNRAPYKGVDDTQVDDTRVDHTRIDGQFQCVCSCHGRPTSGPTGVLHIHSLLERV